MKNKKYNIISYLIIFILMLNIIPLENIFAASHTLAINSNAIEKVSAGTGTDGNYSFSLRPNSSTRCEIWGYGGNVLTYAESRSNPLEVGMVHTMIMPRNNNLSGNVGCWYRNVGNYNGKTVDVKCTYYWSPVNLDGMDIYPLIDATYTNSILAFHFSNKAYEVKYELYSEGKPITVNMSLTFGDIDASQFFGFKMNAGAINKIQCRTDAKSYFREQNGYKWFYAENIGYENTPDSTIRLELNNTSSFNIVYGSEGDYWSYPLDRFYPMDEASSRNSTKNNQVVVANAIANLDFWGIRNQGMGWGFFDSTAYGPYDLPTPNKIVSDSNEKDVTTNNININESFYYDINQIIPQEASSYYYSSFNLVDTLPDCLTYNSTNVYNSAGQDVTGSFNISRSGQTITFSSKSPSSANFYSNTYKFRINVKINKNNLGAFKLTATQYQFKNKATSSIVRNGATISKQSNEVKTNYFVKNITINKIWKDNSNGYNTRPSSIDYILKQDNVQYSTGSIKSTDNWSIDVSNLPQYKPDGSQYVYTVTENTINLPSGEKYIPTISGMTITNTLTATTSKTITKIWNDDNNIYNTRPQNLNITILQNGGTYKTVTLNKSNQMSDNTNNWRLTVNDLPKYDSDGVLYSYTIKEDENNANLQYFYEAPVYDQNNLTVTNRATYIPIKPNEKPKYKITVNKNIINASSSISNEDFNKIDLDINATYNFTITLKELNKTIVNTGTELKQVYNGYSGKEYNGIVSNKTNLIFDDIPAGKYEISEGAVQYFNFVNLVQLQGTSGVKVINENNKYFIEISGLTGKSEDITVKVTNVIDTFRPYDDTKDKINKFQ